MNTHFVSECYQEYETGSYVERARNEALARMVEEEFSEEVTFEL